MTSESPYQLYEKYCKKCLSAALISIENLNLEDYQHLIWETNCKLVSMANLIIDNLDKMAPREDVVRLQNDMQELLVLTLKKIEEKAQ